MSRTHPGKSVDSLALRERLEASGIHVRAKTPNVLLKKRLKGYKDVDEVIALQMPQTQQTVGPD
ncbi:MAG: hypothetical protein Ct9H90mP23_0120 [Methanobacteriota archaeon]|nr:MAG: hypothetical protein Ct9H90mP23_0120 [Euryarchaeota archaeon]